MNALDTYLKAARGRHIALAKRLGIAPSTLTQYRQGRVPAERVLSIEQATGIPRKELRPDLYGELPVREGGKPIAHEGKVSS